MASYYGNTQAPNVDTFNVGTAVAQVSASIGNQAQIVNESGGTLYYKNASTVSSSSSDGNLTAGQSKVFSTTQWIVSTTGVNVLVLRPYTGPDVAGVSTVHQNAQVTVATTGGDTAGVNGTTWYSSLVVRYPSTLTGLAYLIGATGGTDKAIVAFWDSTGAVVANSELTTGSTVGTASTYQAIDFVTPFNAYPGVYFGGVQTNGNTATIRTITVGRQLCDNVAGTFKTIPALTPPTTFSAAKAPILATY